MIDEQNPPISWAWEGQFEYEDPAETKKLGGTKLPGLSIATPERWRAEDLVVGNWHPPVGDARYDILRFVFGLHPLQGQTIERASLTTTFYARVGNHPIVFDLQPTQIDIDADVIKTFSLDPSLKFKTASIEAEASLLKMERSIHFTQKLRVVTTYGIDKSEATWEFEENPAYPLKGEQLLYVVLKTPSASTDIRVSIGASASTRDTLFGGPFRGISPRAEADQRLSFQLF